MSIDEATPYILHVPLHTVAQLEMVLAPDAQPLLLKEVQRGDGSRILLRDNGQIERIISTDPLHYLSSRLCPGAYLP